MKPAFLKDDSFLADVDAHRGSAGLRLWWLGQSGFLLHYENSYFCFDPYLSDSLTRKYAETDKPHVRVTERVVDPARLGMVDVVTSSHNHTDHLDAETLGPMRAANPNLRLVIPEANRRFVADRLSVDPRWPDGIDDGKSTEIGPWRIEGIAAAHEQLDTDEQGRHRYLGFLVEAGPHRIYHSGDCVLYDGLLEKLRKFKPTLMLLPINGSLPERRVSGNFWGREAAQLAYDCGVTLVIPCHYDMFEFNTVTPDEFAETCDKLGQRYQVLLNGEGLTL